MTSCSKFDVIAGGHMIQGRCHSQRSHDTLMQGLYHSWNVIMIESEILGKVQNVSYRHPQTDNMKTVYPTTKYITWFYWGQIPSIYPVN